MRKSVLLIAILALVLMVSGCGKASSLTCTQSTSGVNITFYVGFEGNTINRLDFDYDMDIPSYSKDLISKQDFCSIVKTSMSQYKDAFTSCNQDVSDDHLKVQVKLDVDKAAKNVFQKVTTPSKAKETLEAQGYTCKYD